MSELRKRCEEWFENYKKTAITPDQAKYGFPTIPMLEAFAKEQQITGMEAAREVCKKNADATGRYLYALIDSEIVKLKEGG